jgi:geranylgeranyl pyrophosphate synthase
LITFFKETTKITTKYLNGFIRKEKFDSIIPLLEYALSSTTPGSDRALLVRLACQLEKGTLEDALPGMASWELLNVNLLVTDDFFDARKTKRMGKIPIIEKFGAKTCISLGFILKSLASEVLIKGAKKTNKWYIGDALEILEWSTKWLYYSQYQEDVMAKIPLSEVTLDMYIDLIKNATSVGIGGAIGLGCLLGGSGKSERKKFMDFGITVGHLYQIRDDLIDYINDETLIRKSPFSDLISKRRRLPLLVAYWESSSSEKKEIDRILDKKNIMRSDILKIIDIITTNKVKNRIRNISYKLYKTAKTQLAQLPKSEPATSLFIKLLDLSIDL